MNLKSKSLSVAGIFAYILIIINTVSGFVLGPYILKIVGENSYGVYSTIISFTGTITVVDVGVTQTLIRYIANYRASGRNSSDVKRVCNTVQWINGIIVILAFFVSVGLYRNISTIYSDSFTLVEIELSKKIFLVSVISVITTLLSNYYSGIIAGHGYFSFLNISKTIRLIIRFVLAIVAIGITKNIIYIVIIDAFLSVVLLLAYTLYVKKYIDLPKVKGIVQDLILREVLIYTFLIFIQNLVDQVNSNLDNIIIGSLVGSSAVTIYSFGLTIFHMFQNLSTSISQMLIPYMSEKIASNADSRELEESLIKIGRIQYIIIGAAIFGFIAVGKEFITLWLGKDYLSVWKIALILMIGGMIPLIQNGAIAILKSKNMLTFRTTALIIMASINAISSIYLVKSYGFEYAAVGTAAGFIIINTVIMDIYYYKKLQLNMGRVLWHIMKKITLCNMISMFFARVVLGFFSGGILGFAISVLAYLGAYAILLWLFELAKEEKKYVIGIFKK